MILSALANNQEAIADLICALCVLAAIFAPPFANRGFRKIENWGARVAARKSQAVVAAGIAPILLRVAFLKWFPAPIPGIHDEFSYLLAADTFAHGRLTNPTPAMWIFFETFHVNMQPTYMSKYQPGQGAILAFGQILGHPWIGVLLSVGLMCAAIVWALQGWFPARWALFGGAIAAIQFGIFNYWNDSYWGGAVAAIGGALVVGALPRIVRYSRPRDSLLFGAGAAILANTRPFEGAIFFAAASVLLAIWIGRKRRPGWRIVLRRVLAPVALVLAAASAFMGYYNWRLTGNAALFPYELNDRTYLRTPHFVWQKLRPAREYRNAEFDSFYNDWTREIWEDSRPTASWRGLQNGLFSKLGQLQQFFLPDYLFAVVLAAMPWLWRDAKARALAFLIGAGVCAVLVVVWFEPHYAAPVTAAVFGIVVQAMRFVRRWRVGGRRIGVGVTRGVALFAIVSLPLNGWFAVHKDARDTNAEHMAYRARIAGELRRLPGKQLVIVRYRPEHDPGEEWVYNGADLENGKVIWVREINDADMRPLLNYYHDRQVWRVDADEPRLVRIP